MVTDNDAGRADADRRHAGERGAKLSGIYALVDRGLVDDPIGLAVAVLAAGVRVLQYRAKSGVDPAIVRRMRAHTAAARAILIVNDDVEAALEADGLHVGQSDLAALDLAALRARLGSRLLGISCATPQEARVAAELGADYLGAGPFAPTGTKLDAGAPIGAEGLRGVVSATALPVAAIGGIGLENLETVARSGAAMACIGGALVHGGDPHAAALALVRRWAEVAPA
ncbi:MAG: thiamine phosphate synthase [Candidatus Baltobacteraceae bacterium]|jgi:thiamine-phosphate pyrophosphorylase